VHGEQVVGPSGVDVRFTGTLRFPRDVVAEFSCAFTYDHAGLEAIGSEGNALRRRSMALQGRTDPAQRPRGTHHAA
jgi:hypothetical protein